jgi:hypothetical protein
MWSTQKEQCKPEHNTAILLSGQMVMHAGLDRKLDTVIRLIVVGLLTAVLLNTTFVFLLLMLFKK